MPTKPYHTSKSNDNLLVPLLVCPAALPMRCLPSFKAEEAENSMGKNLANLDFDFHDQGVQVIIQDEVPWFVCKDICALLGMKNIRLALTKLTAKERSEVYIKGATTGDLVITPVISESGLFRLLGKCHKPIKFTKPIKQWVTQVVLPGIRAGKGEEVKAELVEPAVGPVVAKKFTGTDLVNQHFDFGGKNVRVIIQGNEPWFVGKDVCDVLELKTFDLVRRLDDDEKSYMDRIRLGLSPGKPMLLLNEYGLYEAIFNSKKRDAKTFKRWVKREVLPTIRKTGAYMTDDTLDKVKQDPVYIGLIHASLIPW